MEALSVWKGCVEGLSVCVEGSGRLSVCVEGLNVCVKGSGRVECLCGRLSVWKGVEGLSVCKG